MSAHDDGDGGLSATLSIDGRPAIALSSPITVGRDPRAERGDVVVVDNDPLVSKSHLAIDVEAGGFVITDLGSSNGTFLHHDRGETAVPTDSWIPVPPGAEIEFGDQRMTIDLPTVTAPRAPGDTPTPEHGIVAPQSPVRTHGPRRPTVGPAGDEPAIECEHCYRLLDARANFCDRCGTPTAPASETPTSARPPSVRSASSMGHDPGGTIVAPAGTVHGSVAPPSSIRPSGGPLKIFLAAAGVIVLLGVSFVALANLRSGDEGARLDVAPTRVPDSVEQRWSEPVPGESAGGFVDESGVYVTSLDADSGVVEVIGFDRRNGDELWQTELEPTGVSADIAGGVERALLVTVCDDRCSVVGLDLDSGEELWSEQIGDDPPRVTARHVYSIDDGVVEFFDPLTGDRLERARGDEVRVFGGHILVSDGAAVEVFDDELNRVLGPEAVDRADAIAFDGSRLVVAEGDELRFIEPDGTVAGQSVVDVGLIDEVRPTSDDNLILGSDEGVTSVDPVDGRAQERWSQRGRLSAVADVDGGPVVIVDREDGSFVVVEADSGERRFERVPARSDRGFTVPGRNLLVVYEREGFDGTIHVSASRWETGDEVWSGGFDDFATVRDGLVVEISRAGDVTVFG